MQSRFLNRVSLLFAHIASLLLYTVAGGLVLVTLMLAALHIRPVQNRLLGFISSRLESSSSIHVAYGAFSWQPFSELSFSALELESGGNTFFKTDAAALIYSFDWRWPFLCPRELVLTKPIVKLDKDRDGRLSIPKNSGRLATSTGHREPLWASIPLPRVAVVSGSIEARRNGQIVLFLQNVNGVIPLRIVHTSKGPKIKVDLGAWQGDRTAAIVDEL